MVKIHAVDYTVHGAVAVVTCENAPVNQLSYPLRKGMFDAFQKANADPAIEAIVLRGGGRTFIAGADIKEFANGMAFKLALPEVLKAMEASPKPIVAAIHGTALGGGLETALVCHYRVGSVLCKVGVPEVQIGLLPGAGGTQRLPRLIGGMMAMEMVVTGQHVKAGRAYNIGLLDEVVPCTKANEQEMLLNAALAKARSVVGLPLGPRIISRMPAEPIDPFFVQQFKAQTMKKARNMLAPQNCIKAVTAAWESKTFEEGLKLEGKYFRELAMHPQSRALQNVFFAQRMVSKVPGVDPKSALPIRKVGIIGCGTMGGGIAMCFAQIGVPVTVLEIKQDYLDRGMGVIQGNWKRSLKKGKITKKTLKKWNECLKGTTSYSDLSDCDIVIEAVFESMKVKEDVFTKLDNVCKPSCILASNTSSLDLDQIASFTRRPDKVVGCHFFSPANVMQLLENVRGKKTSASTIATVQAMGKMIKKVPVLVGNCWGFVGNRMLGSYGDECNHLLTEGASPYEMDKILYGLGWAMGPFQVNDLAGNDIGVKMRKEAGIYDAAKRAKNFPDLIYYYDIADKLTAQGRLGQKTKRGWYDYQGRKNVESSAVKTLIAETRRELGVRPRKIDKKEIIERTMYALVNEGFKILEEGIATRPSDIDVVYIYGYGFPPYLGGPMHWADTVGLGKIRDALLKYGRLYPKQRQFEVSKLLNTCADRKTTLAKYWKKRGKESKL